jgi:hypothetical protein
VNALRALLNAITAPLRRLSRLPLGLISAPRKLLGLSFSARVSVLLGMALVLLVGTAFICYALFSERPDWGIVARWPVLLTIVALLIAIPLVVYQALKLWLEGETSRYPDIDQAWRAGLDELRKNNIDLQQVPLFLLLGSPGRELSQVLMQIVGYERLIDGCPDGRAPIRWYAGPQAVFLFTEETGCLSRLSSVAARGAAPGDRSIGAAGAPSITGTLVTGTAGVMATNSAAAGPLATAPRAPAIRGTLVPDGGGSTDASAPVGRAATARYLTHNDFDDEADRLRYIGELLRQERQPLCPLNGQVALVPAALLLDIVATQETIEAVRRDLEALREATQLSCPATLLVTGMETVAGFTELVRRVGMQLAKETRFGKGYSVWNPADRENLDALSSQACGAFEDWVYALFREAGGLGKPGNSKLYRLLCLIRGQFHNRIRSLLINGFGRDDETDATGYWMFGGCYFAATGSTEGRQAFVRSVFDKMLQQDEDVEWTDAALIEDQRYRRIAQALTFVNGFLALALVALVIWMFVN